MGKIKIITKEEDKKTEPSLEVSENAPKQGAKVPK